ncbi:hypothetical protein [Burkholderia gladioli]|jgi:hypothetical protein|uniref:Uncharacterized protein n=1 Tax=Burkholderia gladioli TaxID=28095 RepID=A0AAW3F712_BURGA|nr:hypothetical protein [Burkholderia gladioli]AJW96386.1 hypothetical protein BM43_5922 [Burkholderia gladioli]ASD84228.1 hypothetical protein CEJ98_36160 [Burkholderia gladioli pv. gladioli]AWY51649.1 hypothetical protein A8H28_10925 [Burkholderia gladioli pv. gladioli]KAF1058129.1 hypothetical protein LvStA_04721 [Burkholderia gladioli]KGC15610.1 hypothetical protein DM48_1843 [Burkholderia gladioli]
MSIQDQPSRQTALHILRQAPGWVDWNAARNAPNWVGGRITLDGRFSVDELLALLALSRIPR